MPKAPSARHGAFFAAVLAAQREAEAAAGTVERRFSVAGRPLRIRFAGEALLGGVERAMGHLRASRAPEEAMTVRLFDGASTGSRLPPLPWRKGSFPPLGDARDFSGILTAHYPASGELDLFHPRRRLALHWTPEAAAGSAMRAGSPLLMVLNEWMRREGRILVHAAAVGFPDGGVLLAGNSGAGKSTTALACLRSALRYLGDDCCLVAARPRPRAYSVYSSARVVRAGLHRIPELPAAAALGLPTEKALFFLNELMPKKPIASFPLRAVLLPAVTGRRDTALVATSRFAALRAMAPSSVSPLPGAGAEALEAVAAVVRALPCYRLEVGTDLDRIPGVVAGLLSRA